MIRGNCISGLTVIVLWRRTADPRFTGTKDGRFIQDRFQPWVDKIGKHNVDVYSSDGGFNMVLAGKFLKVKNKRLELLHGVDHGCASAFKDLNIIPEFQLLFLPAGRARCEFGTGTRHRIHTAYAKQIKMLNHGQYAGFIRGFDGRYASHFKGLV